PAAPATRASSPPSARRSPKSARRKNEARFNDSLFSVMSIFRSDNPRGRVIGRSVPRLEDPPLVTGRGQFVGDLGFPHQLHLRVVRSPYAHAVLRRIDTAAALAAPGVAAVWTGAEIADLPPIDFR